MMNTFRIIPPIVVLLLLFSCAAVRAELSVPNLFSNHMVLQRDTDVPIWGKAAVGTEISVSVLGGTNTQTHIATTDENGKWRVVLDPLEVGDPLSITISGDGDLLLTDVLVGEVWLCSGQSNMQFSVGGEMNGDIDLLNANYPTIRLITVDNFGSQEPQEDFADKWKLCIPETARSFSAIGYHFATRIHRTLDVPVGLIDNAWGGSAAEAWTPREKLESNPAFKKRIKEWQQQDEKGDDVGAKKWFEKVFTDWKRKSAEEQKNGALRPEPPLPSSIWSLGNARPGNLFQARIAPIAGYSMRGVLWYQGETNAWRPDEYQELFPLMIQSWREAWDKDDLSFYWVQLTSYMERRGVEHDSSWARLREAQSKTLDRLPYTGQAVTIDLGASDDIHPRNKREIANRLARIALAKNYGFEIDHESPRLKDFQIVDNKALVSLAPINYGLQTINGQVGDPIVGFAIRGEDRIWRKAFAKHLGDGKIEVWHPHMKKPVEVRYAWGDNPECNLFTQKGMLPVDPFRTDELEIWR